MFIYLNSNAKYQNEDFLSSVRQDEDGCSLLGSRTIHSVYSSPYIDVKQADPASLKNDNLLEEFFLKAVSISFPKYAFHREYGIYKYGKATAELRPVENDKVADSLKIETDSFNGISDMLILKERLWMGTILPTISYERKQISKTKNFFLPLIPKMK